MDVTHQNVAFDGGGEAEVSAILRDRQGRRVARNFAFLCRACPPSRVFKWRRLVEEGTMSSLGAA